MQTLRTQNRLFRKKLKKYLIWLSKKVRYTRSIGVTKAEAYISYVDLVNPIRHSRSDFLRRQSGFTLIEMIMVLILVGATASVGSLGLVTFIKNFNLSIQATDTANKAQMALLRMAKEAIAITEIYSSSTDGDEIKFKTKHSDSYHIYRLHLSGTELYLTEYDLSSPTSILRGPDLLADSVSSFSLQFYDWNIGSSTLGTSPSTTWTGGGSAVACGTSVTYSFLRKECDDKDGTNRQNIEFTPSSSGTYIVYYGNVEYYACTSSTGSIYYGSQNASSSGVCAAYGWQDDIRNGVPYFDNDGDSTDEAKFWIYPYGEPECAQEFTMTQEFADECTSLADAADNITPSPAVTPPLSRLVSFSLTMEGIDSPFSVSVAPRNLPPVE